MNNLARAVLDQGKFAQAEPLLVKALEVSRRDLGEEHPDTLAAMNNLAQLYVAQGQARPGRAAPRQDAWNSCAAFWGRSTPTHSDP